LLMDSLDSDTSFGDYSPDVGSFEELFENLHLDSVHEAVKLYLNVSVAKVSPVKGPKQRNLETSVYVPENWNPSVLFVVKPSSWFEVSLYARSDITKLDASLELIEIDSRTKELKCREFAPSKEDKRKKHEDCEILLEDSRDEDKYVSDGGQFELNGRAHFDIKKENIWLTLATASSVQTYEIKLKIRVGRFSGKHGFRLNFSTDPRIVSSEASIHFLVVSKPPKPSTPEKPDPKQLNQLKSKLKEEIDTRDFTIEDLKKLTTAVKRYGKKRV